MLVAWVSATAKGYQRFEQPVMWLYDCRKTQTPAARPYHTACQCCLRACPSTPRHTI